MNQAELKAIAAEIGVDASQYDTNKLLTEEM
jgi:hypothetical protein